MIRVISCILCLFIFSVSAFADNVTLYASVDDSNNTVNMLGDLMRNDPAYDAFNQYAILRSGEREYRLYFGKDISQSSIRYIYVPAYMNTQASLTRSVVSSGLNVNKAGYWYVGNTVGSLASSSIDNYNHNYVIGIIAIVVVVLFFFKILRRPKSNGSRYYRVR